ncbi:hypothetical protein [Gaoshiqia sediminis]|uniref:Uncharacterized protein n=1 Tax=Gaoshiqia sediminis TaxID=2986998 RepID=A0AA42C5W0_9BACT|nr:hypothetical protein [Gaoshiqia sediminis]MCW0481939.1 hypothetical protein [Gaoshiqia sediminis]
MTNSGNKKMEQARAPHSKGHTSQIDLLPSRTVRNLTRISHAFVVAWQMEREDYACAAQEPKIGYSFF